jgi:hypothetical protein
MSSSSSFLKRSGSSNLKKSSNSTSGSTAAPSVADDAKRFADDAKNFVMEDGSKELVQYTLMFIGFLAVVKFFLSSLMVIFFLLFPLAYVYLLQTCPSPESFDGKKELKRVLRGTHLPEEHPDKPKGYFGKMAAKVTASITTEMATTLPGSQQTLTNYGGAGILATMKVPTFNMECYWVGAIGEWRYIYSRELNTKQE